MVRKNYNSNFYNSKNLPYFLTNNNFFIIFIYVWINEIFLLDMISSSEEEEEEYQVRVYNFRERVDWGQFSDSIFKTNFRCSRATAEILLQLIGADIQPQYYRNHALSAKERLLIALRFFGDNDDYHAVAAAERIFSLKLS